MAQNTDPASKPRPRSATRALKRPAVVSRMRQRLRSRYDDRGLAARVAIDLALANVGLFFGSFKTSVKLWLRILHFGCAGS